MFQSFRRRIALLLTAPLLLAAPAEADPPFTTAAEVKPILAVTRANWISVREFNGQDLVYVTHLWSWRCGLARIRLAINDGGYEIWPLPPCHLDQAAPNSILEEDGSPYRAFAIGSVEKIEIEVTYDDMTVESQVVNRLGQPISP
ncbi:hypothetical protein PXK01_18410 [Phaeobacter sp. PT47_59]|uniref:hypothetical protein n=1 Tax=Phaeobacter sp. PT47_59 TaxID=3029979 RepID=UPI0023804431|nr:hypothetical protein [Phaeobacter sp. PT47_59]MDE4176134.1 hypothetical protein [Phaeobacter sp. PT47_59]